MTSCWRDSRNQVKSSVKRRLLAKVGCRPMCSFRPTRYEGSMRRMVPAALLNPSHCTPAPTGTHRQCPQQFARARKPVARKCQSHCKRLRRTRQPHLHPHILIRQKTESPLLWAVFCFELTYLKLTCLESNRWTMSLLNPVRVNVCVSSHWKWPWSQVVFVSC